jgi:hypothetical protein
MAKQSFSDAVRESPDRFVDYAFKNNPNIKDFGDFDSAFREEFDTALGKNAKIDSEDLIVLFESNYCKAKMREQVSDKEYDVLYGDGNKVVRVPSSNKKIVTITTKKVTVRKYYKKGKEIKGATRTTPRKFSPAQLKFLKARKQRKVPVSKIVTEYEQHFGKSSPRTKSSISTKVYRI